MRFFKSISIVAALAAAVVASSLSGCAALSEAPSANQVQAIAAACMTDTVLRPTVTALLPLATPVEAKAVDDAHAIIHQVCANPAAAPAANMAASFAAATSQIAQLVSALTERKKAAAAAPAASAASSS